MPTPQISTFDIGIVLAYFVGMIVLGLVLARRSKGAEDYFLAGRNMIWPFIGLSLFASNISSTTLVGLSGDAYATGISVYNYEWMAAVILVIFAVFFLPIIIRRQVFTMPEFLAGRYDGRVRTYFSILTLFLSVVVETAGSLFAGAIVIQLVLPDVPLWQIMTVLALIAGFYTVTGGLSAVMYTDAIQAILLLIGSSVITWIALEKIGGWNALFDQIAPEKLSLVRPLGDAGVPWLGLITGVPILGFYYWATNQAIVQRALAAKTVDHGRWGALFAGVLKLPPLFIMVLPGSMAILLYPELDNANLVYPTMMFDLLPAGLLGLTLAGFLAAIMSQIDSALNSASTLVTMDFVRRAKPDLDSRQLMYVGRVVMVCFLIFAIVWAPVISNFRSIFAYIQAMFSYAVPPVVALFVVGLFWRRANSAGGFACFVTGLALGLAGFLAIEVFGLFSLHFLYMAPLLFLASALALVLGSLSAPAPDAAKIEEFVWSRSLFAAESADLAGKPAWQNYRYQAIALLAVTAIIVVIFR
ncbi:sodium:solute symporter [Erythrobacter rubeus]|uniref:Sodium/solute symporter n=1 Tax=Erythrobacter rubeus TaxID=2760803 RepID=A0ABR8KMT5_9SPHN|nr:sodium:solute symporter [Erythrobacter rubeus]MBD2841899.1 sodium/solute symporter [Erythrobacter rubeus]